MIKCDLQELTRREPFEPFRIKLLNGVWHDVFYPQNVAVLRRTVHMVPPDQNWVIFPLNKIASIESLIADYHGHATGEPA